MNKFTNMDFYDFIYKGKKLSDYGWTVGSSNGGVKTYPLLPSRTYVTEKPLKSNVYTIYDSYLEPRPFEVPIFKEQLKDNDIRKLAMWLDSPIPSKFQWVGDDVYINAVLDSTDFSAQSASGQDGQLALKFICYDPFFYAAKETQYTHTSANFVSGKSYSGINDGYGELDPVIDVSCSGTIKIEVFDSKGKTYSVTNIDNITAGVTINSETQECKLYSGASHFAHIDNFPEIPNGKFTYKITGSGISNASIRFRERYL